MMKFTTQACLYRLRRLSLYLIVPIVGYGTCSPTLSSPCTNTSDSLLSPTPNGVVKTLVTSLFSSFSSTDLNNMNNSQGSLADAINPTKAVATLYQVASSSAAVLKQGFSYCANASINLTSVCPEYVDQYCIGNNQARGNDTPDEGCVPNVPLTVVILVSALVGLGVGMVCGACGLYLWQVKQFEEQSHNTATPATPANPENIALTVHTEDEAPVRPEE